jgi:hypothetical protein
MSVAVKQLGLLDNFIRVKDCKNGNISTQEGPKTPFLPPGNALGKAFSLSQVILFA